MESKLPKLAELFLIHFRDVNLIPSKSNYQLNNDPSTGNSYAEFFIEDVHAYTHKVVLDVSQWNDLTWIANDRRYSISIPNNHNLLNSERILKLYSRYFFWLIEINFLEITEVISKERLESYLKNCQNIYLEVMRDVIDSRNLKFIAETNQLETLITELNDGYFHLRIQEKFLEFSFNRNRYLISTPSMLHHKLDFEFLHFLEDYTHMLFNDTQ